MKIAQSRASRVCCVVVVTSGAAHRVVAVVAGGGRDEGKDAGEAKTDVSRGISSS